MQEVFSIARGISRLAFPIIKLQGTKDNLEVSFKDLAKSMVTRLEQT
jgi:hypothetical protein